MNAAQIAFWEGAFQKLSQSEEWKKELAASYWDANFLSATETAKFYETQAAELRTILTDIGLIK